jgi:[ribosomal protein S5]-alanine N-acetyltransferase
MNSFIETPRLKLRKITPDTFDFIYKNYSDDKLKIFLGLTTDEDLAKEKNRYEKGLSTFNKSFAYFHLLDKLTENNLGWCGFHTWFIDHRRAEIGYVLNDDSYKGKGIMREAIAPIVHFGFNEMNLHRIEAFISPDNEPSLKLVAKLGFTKEGHLREHYFKDNQMEDSLIFSLLRHEYYPS